SQRVDASLRGTQRGEFQNAGGRKRKRPVEQHRIELWPGLFVNAGNQRLVDAVPVLERSFEVSLQIVASGKELEIVLVLGTIVHRALHPLFGAGVLRL